MKRERHAGPPSRAPREVGVAYGAGKAALNMMTRNMAIEFAPKVRVNAIGVGGIDTDSLKVALTDEALAREFLDNTPMGRRARPRTSPPARCTWPRRRRPG